MRKPSKKALARLRREKLASRRETLYKYLSKQNDGIVPCFVCKRHVNPSAATIEHKTPLSKGGSDEMDNLSISHWFCNTRRGNDESFNWENWTKEQRERSGRDEDEEEGADAPNEPAINSD